MRCARLAAVLTILVLVLGPLQDVARAKSAAEIDREVTAAIARMIESVPNAKMFAAKAKGILIFPNMVKAGFLFGAQYGEGALRREGKTVGYYSSVAGSYGLQAGVQSFGYALFFMSDSALSYLDKSAGFEVGVGPSVVVLDQGAARAMTTTTMKDEIYAVFFDQKGLMAGLGIQGTKITKMKR